MKRTYSIYVDEELTQQVDALAKADNKSRNDMLEELIRLGVFHYQKGRVSEQLIHKCLDSMFKMCNKLKSEGYVE